MKIYTELLVLGIILLIVFLWAVWYNLTKKFYKWRYEKKYDTTKSIGGRIETGRSAEFEKSINSNERLEQPAKVELLSTTDVDSIRENRSGTRKGFFFQRRR